MKKIQLFLGVIFLLCASTVQGQQDPQYTQYMYNMNVLNPAYAGSKGVMSVGLLARKQWVNVDGAPSTYTFALHSPIGNAVGLGVSAIQDEIGPATESNIYVDFSYTVFTSDEGRLAFGLKGGFTFLDVDYWSTIDPELSGLNEPVSLSEPNFGAGIFYYDSRFYAGLSVPNFLETRHIEKEGGIVSTASERMHYFLTAGYVFDVSDELKLKPSTMLKATDGSPLSVDLSANLLYKEKVELGLSYRFDDSLSGLVGFQVNDDLRIGYAYDHTTTTWGEFNSGTHELILTFEFNRKNFKSPRFF